MSETTVQLLAALAVIAVSIGILIGLLWGARR